MKGEENKGFKYYFGIIMMNYKLILVLGGVILLLVLIIAKSDSNNSNQPTKVDIDIGQEDLIEPWGNSNFRRD